MRVFLKYLILCISLKLNGVWNEINPYILFCCECYFQIIIILSNDWSYIHLRLELVVQFSHFVTRAQHLPSPKKRTETFVQER